ncbi:MAG: hypothetical protein O7E52_06095 [Candidatus Poribacteria bacterium]|nr:hypothetical protein [Candidatus Poribacteria bacterium]
MMETLKDRYSDWEKWATAADKSEDGWQSDYPIRIKLRKKLWDLPRYRSFQS